MNDRKIYYSFHDMPLHQNEPYGYSQQRSGLTFSREEIKQILIAMGVLTLAFSFALAPYPAFSHFGLVLSYLPVAFLAIATAFLCHEMAHKYMGQKFGYWSEFRMFLPGLLLALFLGVFAGIVFAAPGAVQIFGRPTREEGGKLAAAGPATNMVIGLIFFALMATTQGYVRFVTWLIAYINVFLGLFNLLPFGPLDGMKIFSWRKEVWGLLLVVGIILFIILLPVS
jgi:Zn-dependent protease